MRAIWTWLKEDWWFLLGMFAIVLLLDHVK
jgi:hypothetical protein